MLRRLRIALTTAWRTKAAAAATAAEPPVVSKSLKRAYGASINSGCLPLGYTVSAAPSDDKEQKSSHHATKLQSELPKCTHVGKAPAKTTCNCSWHPKKGLLLGLDDVGSQNLLEYLLSMTPCFETFIPHPAPLPRTCP